MGSDSKVFWSVLPDAAIMPNPFIHFMQVAERAGQLGFHYIKSPRRRTDEARDYICSEFKKLTQNPDDFLVQLDCDHDHPVNVIEGLVANDKPICAAYAVRRNPSNPHPCMWTRDANGILRIPRVVEKKLIQVDVTGSGAIAIKRSVFTALDEAGFDMGYWKYQYSPDGTSESEEIFFNQICASLNIPRFVDGRIMTPHWTEAELDGTSWEQYVADHPIVKREHKTSVIIPQKGRIEKFRKCLGTLAYTAPECEIICVIDGDDTESKNVLHDNKTLFLVTDGVLSPIEKWNIGATLATGDVLMLASNDVTFEEGWLENALDALDSIGDGVVGTNDGFTDGNVSSPHYLATRKWLVENYGAVLACPEYAFQFVDCDICGKAQSMGKYVFARAAKVTHPHPLTNSAPEDEIHQLGYKQHIDADRVLYVKRREEGFPVTWKGGLK